MMSSIRRCYIWSAPLARSRRPSLLRQRALRWRCHHPLDINRRLLEFLCVIAFSSTCSAV
jgi:hypothetical protein